MRRTLLLVCLWFGLSSCTYTYIPPVPRGRVEPAASLDLHASAGIITETLAGEERTGEERLVLLLTASDVPAADWLAVQWFAPDNRQVASASQWLEPSPAAQDVRFVLPDNIPLRPGDWRAVVSYQNRVARQFSLPLEAAIPPESSTESETSTDETSTDTPMDTPEETPEDAAADTVLNTDSSSPAGASEDTDDETPATSPSPTTSD